LLGQPPGLDDDEPIGDGGGVEGIVGHQHARPGGLGEVAPQMVADRSAGAHVQGSHGLVEQEEPGRAHGPGTMSPIQRRTGHWGPIAKLDSRLVRWAMVEAAHALRHSR